MLHTFEIITKGSKYFRSGYKHIFVPELSNVVNVPCSFLHRIVPSNLSKGLVNYFKCMGSPSFICANKTSQLSRICLLKLFHERSLYLTAEVVCVKSLNEHVEQFHITNFTRNNCILLNITVSYYSCNVPSRNSSRSSSR